MPTRHIKLFYDMAKRTQCILMNAVMMTHLVVCHGRYHVDDMPPYLRKKGLIRKARRRSGSRVYMAAVLKFIVAEVLELAGNAAKDNKMMTNIPRRCIRE